jgi:hypothetical protein
MTPDLLDVFVIFSIPALFLIVYASIKHHHYQCEVDFKRKARAVRFKEKYALLKRLTR